jgi:hypothetical protein
MSNDWRLPKPMWNPVEDDPQLRTGFIDLGLGLHNGRPIIIRGNHHKLERSEILKKILEDSHEE